MSAADRVRICDTATRRVLAGLFARYGVDLEHVADQAPIPGSYWGAPEAGIIGGRLYVRSDTPLHSALHEGCHLICMDAVRRAALHTDAGGEYAEEDAVCFLQIVLAGQLGIETAAICADMDAWGYTFRLGSALAWFRQDAEDARAWLLRHDLLAESGAPSWRLRVA